VDRCLNETKDNNASSRGSNLSDDIFADNNKHHHRHSSLIIRKYKEYATKITSDLVSALWKQTIHIVQIENRPFSYCNFVPYFELNGGTYSITYGTIAAVKAHHLEMMSDNE
jgi:hypothetical protein